MPLSLFERPLPGHKSIMQPVIAYLLRSFFRYGFYYPC
ncbi:hypothetical protein RIEGSTA812A_PEG_522 [invertebrate metagenome]|uniref:Uncharacterized protein n=1 Tax=invertebrate metagenome TaxID=1711999 RepID=A0A484H587_9ZZZZ